VFTVILVLLLYLLTVDSSRSCINHQVIVPITCHGSRMKWTSYGGIFMENHGNRYLQNKEPLFTRLSTKNYHAIKTTIVSMNIAPTDAGCQQRETTRKNLGDQFRDTCLGFICYKK
jgi:hypothetical protein